MPDPIDDGRRQLRNVRVDHDLADWAQDQARGRGVGIGPIVEDALRDYRTVVERDRANPRPETETT